ncbi:MAG: sulfurtransferase, partial [Solirubrobacterales bacterium]
MSEYANDVLVATDWLAEHLDDDSIRIVEVDENPDLYAEAHIPGAIGFDWKEDLQDPVRRDFLDAEAFGELMGSRGISNDHTVVLYGDRNNWFAAYTYWYFRYYGHDNVKLVNGPREKWIDEGRETSTEAPSYPAATFTTKAGDDSIRAYRDQVKNALDADTRLVDVRSPAEYAGEILAMEGYEQEGAQVGGHIPGAIGFDWKEDLQDPVRRDFLDAEAFGELMGSRGISNDHTVVLYGDRNNWFAAYTYWYFRYYGHDNVKLVN